MISGPTYGSIMELQRAADTTPSRPRRQYTRPVTLFHKRKRKMHTHPEQGHPKLRTRVFAAGILFEARCYTYRSTTTRHGELCANNGKFLRAFFGPL